MLRFFFHTGSGAYGYGAGRYCTVPYGVVRRWIRCKKNLYVLFPYQHSQRIAVADLLYVPKLVWTDQTIIEYDPVVVLH